MSAAGGAATNHSGWRHWLLAVMPVLLMATSALAQTAPRADLARFDYRLAARQLAPGVYVV